MRVARRARGGLTADVNECLLDCVDEPECGSCTAIFEVERDGRVDVPHGLLARNDRCVRHLRLPGLAASCTAVRSFAKYA